MAMNPEVFGKYADNLLRYYERMRKEDLYGVYGRAASAGRRAIPTST